MTAGLPPHLRPGRPLDDRLSPLSLAVVGAAYPNKDGSDRRFEIMLSAPGDPIALRPEPRNRHDPTAVAVFSQRGVQIGYLTAERCGRIGQLIREGRELRAVFQSATHFGAWIRVAFDGEQPAVPAQREIEHEEPDFYPDEEWPD